MKRRKTIVRGCFGTHQNDMYWRYIVGLTIYRCIGDISLHSRYIAEIATPFRPTDCPYFFKHSLTCSLFHVAIGSKLLPSRSIVFSSIMLRVLGADSVRLVKEFEAKDVTKEFVDKKKEFINDLRNALTVKKDSFDNQWA